MKTALSVSALLACLALSASAEKVRPENPAVFQRSTLNTDARTVTCVPVIGQPSGTTILYTFTLDAECCDWFVSACGNDHIDTYMNLYHADLPAGAFNDDLRCSYPCTYGPSEIGSGWGDGCLPAGEYFLEIYLYNGYIPGCVGDFGPQDYTFCFDFCDNGAAGAEDQPVSFELGDAFPNPFNPSTTINFSLAETADASLKVYNMAGAEVASLVSGLTAAGQHSVTFDAASLTSGVYFYTLEVAGLTQTRKMVLVK
jgi:hypothetical protein